ncbi:hypothetical protein [Metabacillus halosaccharovorans]|uniref:hypothetical protein n=1 Tax=Metabacillus halosaccharovorans TaxID=930124 RepID=UPI00203C9D6C|nr:hypothetical protein [Metabacillus halosaccharovorans]MCM3442964.1 hypothetical protein [Metabacillus halosaccharovorans]
MFANTTVPNKKVKKRKVRNKFSNMSKKDWEEANEESKKNRGISAITHRDIYGG